MGEDWTYALIIYAEAKNLESFTIVGYSLGDCSSFFFFYACYTCLFAVVKQNKLLDWFKCFNIKSDPSS